MVTNLQQYHQHLPMEHLRVDDCDRRHYIMEKTSQWEIQHDYMQIYI